MSHMKWISFLLAVATLVSGCASSKIKDRKEQRDRVAHASKTYCEFVNGEIYPDIDVALNLQMAKQCDLEKPFSITQYKTPSENSGVLYCCNMAAGKTSTSPKRAPKVDDKKVDEKKTEDKKTDASVQ